MRELVSNWYVVLSTFYVTAAEPLRTLGDGIGIPAVSALLFGLIGATSPCQLTTNASALAFLARRADNRRQIALSTLAYVLAKVLVYSLAGALVISAGREIIPVAGISLFRKALGPLMLLLGFYFLGLLPFHFSIGHTLAGWLEDRAGSGVGGAFMLGTAFSLAFCPTLFLLFFVLTLPLALSSPVGVLYPGLFAVGTVVPLLALAALVTTGVGAMRRAVAGAHRLDVWLKRIAALVLILAGLNDTMTYWLL